MFILNTNRHPVQIPNIDARLTYSESDPFIFLKNKGCQSSLRVRNNLLSLFSVGRTPALARDLFASEQGATTCSRTCGELT